MPRPVQFTMVVDRHTDTGRALPPPSNAVHFPSPVLILATLAFWTIVLIGLKLVLA